MSEESNGLSLFISHRHEDKAIADAFREALEGWSNGAVHVFQSSHAENAMRIGESLDDIIVSSIADSNVVLLVYTMDETDWSWCMYECGLAQDPETMDTRLVVFHCTEEPPGPLKHLVTVPFELEALRGLADDFHRDADFFPRHADPLAPQVTDEQLHERADELFGELRRLIPKATATEVKRYDQLTFGIGLDRVAELEELERTEGFRAAHARAKRSIEELAVVRRVDGEPHGHFDIETISEGTALRDLVDRWKGSSEHPELTWHEDLYDEMARAVLNRRERALGGAFDSLVPDSAAWLLPVVSRYRVVPSERVAEFDVVLCPLRPEMVDRST